MLGYVDSIDDGVAKGWIVDEREGRRGLVVQLWLDGRMVAQGAASERREDLLAYGLDGAAAGFAIPFTDAQHDGVGGILRVHEASTGFLLVPGSIVVDPKQATAPLDVRRLEPRIAQRLAATRSLADLDAQVEALQRLARSGAARAEAIRNCFGGADRVLIFERPAEPVASVVVAPGAGLYEALRSLAEHEQQTSFELVVADDAAAPGVEGAVWSKAPEAVARGRYLVFLPAETRATPGWLDAMIATFDDPTIGVVGARLIGADGRVLDCGGEGRGAEPGHPSVRFRRDCETPGAAFAVRQGHAQPARVVVQPAASLVWTGEALPALARARAGAKPRALFIDDWTPRTDRDAGSYVALQHMLSLQRLGSHVIFIASTTLEDAPHYTPALERLGVECACAPYYASIEDALSRLAPLALVYLHRFPNADKYLESCRRLAPSATILYGAADLHGLREQRAAALGVAPERPIDGERELQLLASADVALVHSSHEARIVRAAAPNANVHCIAWPVAVASNPAPFAARANIGFIGGYGHPPNADAVGFYARDILPAFDGAPPLLRMAGSGMTDEIRALANASIRAEGQVAEAAAFLSGLRATIAPLRFGAGLKGKVLDSLAQGTPCVMTSIAAEGLDLPEALAMCVADEPRDIAARMLKIVGDESLWTRLSNAGLRYIAERYNPRRIDELLAAALNLVAS